LPKETASIAAQDTRDTVYDEHVVAADMVDFLRAFRSAHPSYFENPLYITGESYGGMSPPCSEVSTPH